MSGTWHLGLSDNKPNIEEIRLLVYNNHGWDLGSHFWSSLGRGQTISWIVLKPLICVASQAL